MDGFLKNGEVKMNQRILRGLIIFFFIKGIYSTVVRPLLIPLVSLPDFPPGIYGSALPFVLFSFAHAIYSLGWRHTLVFFVLSFMISWAFEQAGVMTGWIFGDYYYTDVLGLKLGYVPILIPFSWFMMLYPSYLLTNCLTGDDPIGTFGGLGRIICISLVSAVVMVAQDLIIDPIMSGSIVKAWVWQNGGSYFGVPARNYLGWIITSFVIYLIYRLFEWRVNPRPMGPINNIFVTMPLLMYGSLIIVSTLSIAPGALKVIGPFVLGLPLLVALTRIWFRPYPLKQPLREIL
jgi:uncharacterized membrane protein